MLTYEEVQRIYRLEKNSPGMQEIPRDFYAQALGLIETIEEKHRPYLTKLLNEIYERRKVKIVLQALRTESVADSPLNIIPQEGEYYREVVGVLLRCKETILCQKPEIPEEDRPEEKVKMLNVRILKPLPSLVGSDSKSYGPFKEDSVIKLPDDSARILIERGAAEEIK